MNLHYHRTQRVYIKEVSLFPRRLPTSCRQTLQKLIKRYVINQPHLVLAYARHTLFIWASGIIILMKCSLFIAEIVLTVQDESIKVINNLKTLLFSSSRHL